EGIRKYFWNSERRLLADDLGQEYYSQHSNCLGIIAGLFDENEKQVVIQTVMADDSLSQCTIYFKYYLFEALYQCDQGEALHNEYHFWGELVDQGLKTCVEAPEPTRSDCHAWGAHPMYHLVASIAGLRPADLNNSFQLKPCLHDLTQLDLSLPHPAGTISLGIDNASGTAELKPILPSGLTIV
ncbi:MAG: hypothetical protein HRU15_15200, partial [Planctomycetes bacterium]|nr:hypothetical protein [Planctomycetota bacterium]